jgi:hypothetical protein
MLQVSDPVETHRIIDNSDFPAKYNVTKKLEGVDTVLQHNCKLNSQPSLKTMSCSIWAPCYGGGSAFARFRLRLLARLLVTWKI